MPLEPGARLDDYVLLQPLGSGGMGDDSAPEAAVAREPDGGGFLLEPGDASRIASSLNHPHVCTILALGETSDGQHYIAIFNVLPTIRCSSAGAPTRVEPSVHHSR